MLDLIESRDRDFLNTCLSIRNKPEGFNLPLHLLATRASESCAPCYYVTFDYAHRMLRLLRKGKIPPKYSRMKLQQWEEIKEKVDRIRLRYGIKDDASALGIVLARGCASRFFITPRQAVKILKGNKEN